MLEPGTMSDEEAGTKEVVDSTQSLPAGCMARTAKSCHVAPEPAFRRARSWKGAPPALTSLIVDSSHTMASGVVVLGGSTLFVRHDAGGQ